MFENVYLISLQMIGVAFIRLFSWIKVKAEYHTREQKKDACTLDRKQKDGYAKLGTERICQIWNRKDSICYHVTFLFSPSEKQDYIILLMPICRLVRSIDQMVAISY